VSSFRLSAGARPTRYALRFETDLEAWTFRGSERCDLVLDRPTRELVLHAVDLELSDAAASVAGARVAASIALDRPSETARFSFDRELPAGACALELSLAGAIRDDLRSLYRSTRGRERYALTTLWPAESRRLYACFDEPAFKARFALELVTAPDVQAVANAELVEGRPLPDGRVLWRFAETPPLSPYLLAFAVGPFEGTPVVQTRSGRPVRVWVPRGLAADAEYARDAQRDCIDRLEEYTGIPYPYDKVEGVGVADFPAGAMENPGAVTYRLELLTAAPGKASARALKSTVGVAAHELTHMWWGDLVTLAWWDDLWLSESFATFVGNKVTDELHPEWTIWRDFVFGMTRGFAFDALASTHAIHAPAESAAAALQRVDPVTYQKGAAVLRMLETYLGADIFRRGVRLYLERFRESVATASDFWAALDEASGQDVTRVARAWITQPGHPLVALRLGEGGLELDQRRFFADQAAHDDQVWPVPLVLRGPRGEDRVLLDAREARVPSPQDDEWLFPNARAAGFYRFALDGELRRRLLAHYAELSPEERLLLLDNDWALLLRGDAHARDHVALLRMLGAERDRAVLAAAHEQLHWLADHAAARGSAFEALVGDVFGPVLRRLGDATRAADDDDDERELRAIALRAMGDLARDVAVRREAAERIGRHLDGQAQDADLVPALAAVAALDGDAALHGRYAALLRASDPQEIERFRPALPLFRDPDAAAATIARIDDRTIRDQDLGGVFWRGLRNVAQRALYWSAFRERYGSRIAPLEGMVRQGVISGLSGLTPPALAAEADAFLGSLREPDTAEVVAHTRESLRLASTAAQRIARELAQALGYSS